jgi:hypothetical protein
VSDYPGAPGIMRELLHGPFVVCDRIEAEEAMEWGRAHPAWTDEPAPLAMVYPIAERASTAAPD